MVERTMKCDRCKKSYEVYGTALFFTDQKLNGMQFIHYDGYRLLRPYEEHMDLCPDCMKQLIKWTKNKEFESEIS